MKHALLKLQYRIYKSLSSIATQYFFFAFIAPLLLIIITALVGWFNYQSLQQHKNYQYWEESDTIASVLHDSFNTTSVLLNNIQNQIYNSHSIEDITSALQRTCYDQHPVSAVLIHCLYANENIIHRSHESLPLPSDITTSIISNEIEHAAPITVYTNNHTQYTYIPLISHVKHSNPSLSGDIILLLPASHITQKIERHIKDPAVSYIIATVQGTIISQSYLSRNRPPQHLPKAHMFQSVLNNPSDNGIIDPPVIDNFLEYHFFQTIYPQQYIILVGENAAIAKRELLRKIMPHIIQTFAIGSFLILLLYFFQRILIRPIVMLSHAADQIANQDKKVLFPRSSSHEINNLVRALINIRRSFIHEEQLKKQLTKATEGAKDANHAKSQFLANMSHELRTPLGAIIGFAELLTLEKSGKLTEEQKSFTNIIYSSGKHLLNIINDILNLSKIEAGRMELHEQDCNLIEISDSCLEYMKEFANEAKVHLKTHYPPTSICLYADEMKIKQIIINLLSNAIKFTPSDGTVTIELSQDDEGTYISVTDTGIGIAENDITTILEEYGQVGSAYARRQDQGTGLGLAIVKKFTELHQAEFTLESTINIGTKVTIHFPTERSIIDDLNKKE